MTKSKQFSRNLAKNGLLFNLFILSSLILSGCTSSTQPTYPKKSIAQAIQDICKKEYKIDVLVKLAGSTLWIYLPIPEGILEKSKKPEKVIERFTIEQNNDELKNEVVSVNYLIKPVPEQEKLQDMKYSKAAFDKISNVWTALRRVIFSMERPEQNSPKFFVTVTADTKNGFLIKETFYYPDFKKVSYGLMSWGEYQHRVIQETEVSPEIIGDTQGLHLKYSDISFGDFILQQIQHRIRLKFQKPEAEKNADVDKEILKIIRYTLKAYGFKNFSTLELNNLATVRKITLNQAAVFSGAGD